MALYPSNFATGKRNPPPDMLQAELYRAQMANQAAAQERKQTAENIGAVGNMAGTGLEVYQGFDYADKDGVHQGNRATDWVKDKLGKGNVDPRSGALRGNVGTSMGGNAPATGGFIPGSGAASTVGSGLGAAGTSAVTGTAPAASSFIPGAAAASTAGSGLGAAGASALAPAATGAGSFIPGAAAASTAGAGLGAAGTAGLGAAGASAAPMAAMGPPGWAALAALAAGSLLFGSQYM